MLAASAPPMSIHTVFDFELLLHMDTGHTEHSRSLHNGIVLGLVFFLVPIIFLGRAYIWARLLGRLVFFFWLQLFSLEGHTSGHVYLAVANSF